LDRFTDEIESQHYLDVCFEGVDVGLLSEAGVPAVADPGAIVVEMAHHKNIKVKPLVGPSSIIMAMMGSGLNGMNFAFNGYLPIDKVERKKSIKQLERVSFEKDQSQLFIETPYRNEKMFADLKQTLLSNTRLCIAVDITLSTEDIRTMSIEEWKHIKIDLHKRPAIFIIHKK
jgi:16S rRNA (cytidine1402-2'-O)-methyltransferase